MADAIDLLMLDRDVARVFARWDAWRLAPVDAIDPFDRGRRAAGQSMYVALAERAPSVHEAELHAALLRWVYAMTQARLAAPLDVAWENASREATGKLDADEPRLVSWREAWRGIAASRTTIEGALWLDAAADVAPKLAGIARERAARRAEIARRMGTGDADAPLTRATRAALEHGARALLDRTEDLARAAEKEAARRELAPPAGAVIDAVGRDAPEGWPAHLTPRWLDEVVGTLAKGLAIAPRIGKTVLGGSSFARALYAFGFAHRVACAAASGLPFALAREPFFEDAHRVAYVVCGLAASPEFHQRALHTSHRVARKEARVLARAALLDARLTAARYLLADPARYAPAELFEELGARLLGGRLSSALAGAWPAPREDEPARLLALLTARALGNELVQRFDVDWFRNPKAALFLRGRGTLPARPPSLAAALGAPGKPHAPNAPDASEEPDAAAPEALAASLARSLEEAFG